MTLPPVPPLALMRATEAATRLSFAITAENDAQRVWVAEVSAWRKAAPKRRREMANDLRQAWYTYRGACAIRIDASETYSAAWAEYRGACARLAQTLGQTLPDEFIEQPGSKSR